VRFACGARQRKIFVVRPSQNARQRGIRISTENGKERTAEMHPNPPPSYKNRPTHQTLPVTSLPLPPCHCRPHTPLPAVAAHTLPSLPARSSHILDDVADGSSPPCALRPPRTSSAARSTAAADSRSSLDAVDGGSPLSVRPSSGHHGPPPPPDPRPRRREGRPWMPSTAGSPLPVRPSSDHRGPPLSPPCQRRRPELLAAPFSLPSRPLSPPRRLPTSLDLVCGGRPPSPTDTDLGARVGTVAGSDLGGRDAYPVSDMAAWRRGLTAASTRRPPPLQWHRLAARRLSSDIDSPVGSSLTNHG
jgi:hypothetical protein